MTKPGSLAKIYGYKGSFEKKIPNKDPQQNLNGKIKNVRKKGKTKKKRKRKRKKKPALKNSPITYIKLPASPYSFVKSEGSTSSYYSPKSSSNSYLNGNNPFQALFKGVLGEADKSGKFMIEIPVHRSNHCYITC